jgi:hypothetical protein
MYVVNAARVREDDRIEPSVGAREKIFVSRTRHVSNEVIEFDVGQAD